LLGAITAHERDRKREGGMGAALTERERERRLAEERQRKFDEAQRQQLEQMQTGSMYGGQFGYNPMMNPMMMGMNPMMPMMTGGPMTPMMTGQMGYGGFNPQHMFAAQQAAQAYQQAMMAFSVAGSQAGDTAGQQQQQMGGMSPMMTGGMSFDPRMTMMSGMGGMGGMGMMGNPMMNPMGMQMTGISQFDPRFSPNGASPSGELHAPSAVSGAQFNPQTGSSSPLRHGSPLARSTGTPDNARSSPKV
jgi:CCR4-NOT transcriptional complex subunit CAF120